MTVLFERINPWEIIRCHFLTFNNDKKGKLDYIEIAVVILLPIFLASFLLINEKYMSQELAKSLFTVYAILGGFFVNSLVLLANRKDSLDNTGAYLNKSILIKETYHNIAFGVLVSFTCVVLSAIYQFIGSNSNITIYSYTVKFEGIFSFLIYSFSMYFLHTLFMVIKRLNRLFSDYISS